YDTHRNLTSFPTRRSSDLVNNAIKHSEADKIQVSINPSDKEEFRFKISVSDNGKGMQFSEKELGNGLQNMKNRISEIGGTLEFRSEEHTSELQSRENLVCR